MINNTRKKLAQTTLFSQARLALLGTARASFLAVFLTTGGLILQVPSPAYASDGCSGPVNGTGITFDFREACNRHDACYTLVRGSKTKGKYVRNNPFFQACDQAFWKNMRKHCRTRWGRIDPRRFGCNRMADSYFTAVYTITIRGRR